MTPRLTILADETGDEAHRTQLATLYKILLMDSYEPTVVYAGLDHLLRGTAKMIWGSIKYRTEHCDGIDLAKKFAFACYDTCPTMFGNEGGTATLQVIDFPRSIPCKCLNHKKQLALNVDRRTDASRPPRRALARGRGRSGECGLRCRGVGWRPIGAAQCTFTEKWNV